MKTERTEITRDVYVFVVPKSDWEINSLEPGELPYRYEVKSYDYGSESSVRIHKCPVTVTIPAGIDITMECISNLREQISEIRKKADTDIENLEERIRRLALLEYNPEISDET